MVLTRCSFPHEKAKTNPKYTYNIWLFLKVKKKVFYKRLSFQINHDSDSFFNWPDLASNECDAPTHFC